MAETHLTQSRQTVNLGLIIVTKQLFPEESLKIAYSIQEALFCRFTETAISVREVRQIDLKLKEWILTDPDIEFLSREGGYYHYRVAGNVIKMLYPCETSVETIGPFDLIPYADGFIISFREDGQINTLLVPPDKLSATYDKTQKWLKNIKLELLRDVNSYIASGATLKLIGMAEALQEKEISNIADVILQRKKILRVLLISGASSSGKTSFSQRLSTQLSVNGFNPITLSLDDYFVNREKSPRDACGRYDFDCVEALDIKFMQQQLSDLIDGKTVETPIFDFKTGLRSSKTRKLHVGPDDILVVEGIHALNPILFPNINRIILFKVYITALYELNIDLINRVPSTEVRMIRRIVRGDQFRGTHPEETLKQWDNVRLGEYNNIFKFQEEADVMFNSSLLYEVNALRPYAEESLNKIEDDSPFAETKERLLRIISFFEPMDTAKVPFNSILREFIGGSIYFD
ncbi:nucleoside kinase [Dehalobacterium formicoaceticum]|uniref:Nucleoside kinase n=1 Tax=Dehalobacterium formicoaceticum TaxID=51515 RepID=A0ABT1Y6N2_9FIRM|nr:nucleoside kinase [Dehalobacterium formicoaceticum]MCR6546540.1 nucleoside kinase [Dehalobacterium formicoaceticum]